MSNLSLDVIGVLGLILFYWIAYMIATLMLFIVFSYIFQENATGLFLLISVKKNKSLYLFTVIALASAAGLPPFLGFWSKLLLLTYVTQFGGFFFICVTWLFLLSGLVFYLRNLRLLYAWDDQDTFFTDTPTKNHVVALLVLAVFLCFGIFFMNDLLLLCFSFFY